jgi:hypothetical protein
MDRTLPDHDSKSRRQALCLDVIYPKRPVCGIHLLRPSRIALSSLTAVRGRGVGAWMSRRPHCLSRHPCAAKWRKTSTQSYGGSRSILRRPHWSARRLRQFLNQRPTAAGWILVFAGTGLREGKRLQLVRISSDELHPLVREKKGP